MVASPVCLGLIGCGRAAERLWLPALHAVREARLVAAADPRAERRAMASTQISGCRGFEQAQELVASGKVDAIVIATPPETHLALASLVLEARLPLLVEKPLAPTVAQAIELDTVRRRTGTPLMVGLNRRWWLPVERLRERLRQREPAPARAELVFVTDTGRWGAVAGAPDLLDDVATHQLDLLRFLFNQEIQSVSATRATGSETRMQVRLADGTSAACRVADGGPPEESVRVVAGALRAWIHAKSDRMAPSDGLVRGALDLTGRAWRKLTGQRSTLLRSFEHELRAFVAMVRDGTEPTPSATDGIAAVRAIAAARASLAQGGRPATP